MRLEGRTPPTTLSTKNHGNVLEVSPQQIIPV